MDKIGVLYTIANTIENEVNVIAQYEDGSIESIQKVATGGKGTDGYSSFREVEAPQLSSYAIVKSSDSKFLFVCNTGDNSVSSFQILEDGGLKLVDNQKTYAPVDQTLISLAYNEKDQILYASHFIGQHLALFKVDEGKLSLLSNTYNVNTEEFPERVTPAISISPDFKFLLVPILIDGALSGGEKSSIKDNIAVFEIKGEELINRKFFSIEKQNYALLFIRPDLILMTSEVDVHGILIKMDQDGNLTETSSIVVDSEYGDLQSEACWQVYDEQTKTAYISNFAYGTITSAKIDKDQITKLNDIEVYVPSDGTFKAVTGVLASAPTDIGLLNRFVYQIFAGVGLLIGYSINDDGSLKEVNRIKIGHIKEFGIEGVSLK